ncbi:MAG TPA: hypothetical protein VN088_19740 [Nocardioides sp.]|nr:hypothetical protein [Nocardioides sp.]
MALPETAEDFHARLVAQADGEGRLPVVSDAMAGWDIFPFELDGLRLKPLRPLGEAEWPRHGEDPAQCGCAGEPDDARLVWSNQRWRLGHVSSTGLPLMMTLDPIAHHDLNDLPDDLAGELGRLMVAICSAMEELPSVGRAHVQKIGDGAAHLHVWFIARPARTTQFLGSPLLDWEESFPRVPEDVLRANAGFVAAHLVDRVGGSTGPFAG